MKIYIVTYNTKLSMEAYDSLEKAQQFIFNREGMEGIVETPQEIQMRVQDKNGGIYLIYEVNVND